MLNEKVSIVVSSVLATMVALAPVAYMAYRSAPPSIVTVDLQKLVEEEQQRTVDVLGKGNGVISDEQRQAIQRLTEDFAKKLSLAIEELGTDCHCVIVNKAALLGGSTTDLTDLVRERIAR